MDREKNNMDKNNKTDKNDKIVLYMLVTLVFIAMKLIEIGSVFTLVGIVLLILTIAGIAVYQIFIDPNGRGSIRRRYTKSQRDSAIAGYIAQAEAFRAQGDTANTVAVLEKLCSEYPKAEHSCMLADEYIAAGDLSNALANYKKAISLDPGCAYANIGAGRCLLDKGDPFAARSFLSKAIDLMPQTDAYYGESQAYYALACAGCGDMTEAQRALRRAEAAGYAECEKIRTQLEAEK